MAEAQTEKDRLTTEEKRAIRSLQRLAEKWPRSLGLLSWSGSLVVLPVDEMVEPVEHRTVSIHGIPNEGGDPDGSLDFDFDGDTWEDQMTPRRRPSRPGQAGA